MNIRKLILLILNVTLSIFVLGIGVFAWLLQDEQPGDLEGDFDRDIFVSSSALFDAFIDVKVPNKNSPLTISSSEFQRDGDLSIQLKVNNLPTKIENGKSIVDLSVDVYVKPTSDTYIRFKALEKYLNNDKTTVINQDLFKIVYANNIILDEQHEYVYHDEKVNKGEGYIKIPLISHLEINVNSLSNYNYYLNLIVIINGIQANRNNVWEKEDNNFRENVTFNNDFDLNNFVIDRDNLSNINQTFKNTALIFRKYHSNGKLENFNGKYDEYVYIDHPRNDKDNFTIPSGTYELIIYSLNQLKLTLNSNTDPNKLMVDYFYDEEIWGLEDYILGMNPIFEWESNKRGNYTGLSHGDLIYYDDDIYEILYNTSAYEKPSITNNDYRILGDEYDGKVYLKGTYLFYNGSYYYADYDVSTAPPHQAWISMSLLFDESKTSTYKNNSIAYIMDDNNKKWFVGVESTNSFNQIDERWSNWKEITYDFNEKDTTSKYDNGELIKHNDNYYLYNNTDTPENPSNNYNSVAPGTETNSHFILTNNRGAYSQNINYNYGDIVVYQGGIYLWRNDIPYNNEVPGIDVGWYYISKEDGSDEFVWNPLNTYKHTGLIKEHVYYNGKTYLWKGENNSNSELPPGESREGWHLISDSFSSFDTYKKGEYVVQDGSLWRAKKDIDYDSNGVNILPRGIGSFEYWEEVTISLNPGRN